MRLKEIERFTVIHCDTRDKVAEIFKKVKESDYPIDIWNKHKENTCVRVCEGVVVGFDQIDYYIEKGYKITEFSDLIIPELSAKEALETLYEICDNHGCTGCPLKNCCPTSSKGTNYSEAIGICTKWREEHPKEEKKELETEWVYVVRIIKVHDNGKKECVHEVDLTKDEQTGEYPLLEDFVTEQLKKYCSEHNGNFFAVYENICRIKE